MLKPRIDFLPSRGSALRDPGRVRLREANGVSGMSLTRFKVAWMLASGLSQAEIARRLGGKRAAA